jgi:hypothetical protein
MMGWVSRHERLAVFVLLAAFFVLATVYNVTSTPFEAPDEIGHFYYIVHLLQNRGLPVVPSDEPHPNYEQEGIQPPLYYASAALFVRAFSAPLRLDLDDADVPLDKNPHSACGQPGARYNVAWLAHDVHQEQFPYQGRVRVLHVVRVWSSLLGVVAVAGVFAAVRLAFPETPTAAWLAAGLTAFTPEFLFTAGAASNDNLVTALTTWGVYLALRVLRDGPHWRTTLALGLLAGLAVLSKFSGVLLLPLALVTILLSVALDGSKSLRLRRLVDRWPFVICHLSFVILFFSALTGWWFVRNWTLYGDLTGTRPMLEMLPLRKHQSVWMLFRELPGLFRSWWGVFGCTAPPIWFYLPYLVLVLVGLGGLVTDRRWISRDWPQVGVLLFWLALMSVAYARWNWVIHAAKGRLLYPAVVSVAGLIGQGWAAWSARWRWLNLALSALLVAGAVAVPFAVLAPPVSSPHVFGTDAGIQPGHTLDGRFGEEIALLGYDLNGTSFEPGQRLDLTLYWQALSQPSAHYTLAIQLVSAAPDETDTLVNFNTWTGGGNYPTGNWHAGDVIADRYRLRLPEDVDRAQAWELHVILFGHDGGRRLRFALGGQPAGKAARLALVRVGASDPETLAPPDEDRLDAPVRFGEVIALDGLRVTAGEKALGVALWWRSVASLGGDHLVFVHIYDAEGQLVATADGPPLSGGFPTSTWRPGDRVRDERKIDWLAEGSAPFRLGVGWYDPVTGARLAATGADGVRLPDDTVLIPLPR